VSLIEKLKKIIEPVLENMGVELVEATLFHKGGRLTLYVAIDKEVGISHQDCSNVSSKVGEVLEREDIIKQRYDLEVSSPGIERPLTKPAHFERFEGSRVKLKTKEPIRGQRNFTGLIKKADKKEVSLALDEKTVKIPYEEISKANLKVDIKF